jgi:hypothetical protein
LAEIFPNEALTYLIEIQPRSNTGSFPVTTAMYMGLFSSQTASTVPSADATLTGSASSPYTTGTALPVELTSTGGYARAAIGTTAAALQTSWPAPVVSGSGMRSTMVSPGTSFAESTGAYNATINGFFVCTTSASTGQNTGKTWFYANFSDTTAITVNAAGFTIRIAAFWHIDG